MKRFNLLLLSLATIFILISGCTKVPENNKLNIAFEKFTMPNGLQVILHTDHSDPIISYTIMYHVGSSRELPGKTGFAHLFEHLLFGGSENAEPGRFDKVIEGTGGYNNGFTSRDITTYFEVFPKNALEKILWLESDRMGFFINSVTPHLLALQQNVVQNEKRQGEDNSPYGFTDYVIDRNLYPSDHPYNWEVIGEMDDLKNASLADVRNYYGKFYGPNNATLVLAGDFNPDSVKVLLSKYFGEIKAHGDVQTRGSMNVNLNETKKLYHEDNFANVPELTMVWPVAQAYSKDAYALDFLARLLADGKKAPFYKVLVKEKQLTSRSNANNSSSELAGEFTISIRANQGKSLKEIENAIGEAFARFEKDGITDKDIERIKASSEKSFYSGLGSVFNKSLQLAFYNTFLNDPGYIEKDIENIKAVTKDDVMRVYNQYIKGKPYIATSFVPKGKMDMVADNSTDAGIKEEDIKQATKVEIADEGKEVIAKTPSTINRTLEPPAGPEPEINVPVSWHTTLENGINVFGIENKELPLAQISIVIDGGIQQDNLSMPGVASMVTKVLPQGTKSKTPEELEEETELLGSDINMFAGVEEMTLGASTLSRNFGKSVGLLKEILLEPRWDTTEFRVAKTNTKNRIIQSLARPEVVAAQNFQKLVYGPAHILSGSSMGTIESVDKMTLDDLKAWYDRCFSPKITRIIVVGNVSKEQVLSALKPLATEWKPKDVGFNTYVVPPVPDKAQIYFVDIPGSRQSVINIGYPALARTNPDFVKVNFINYRLGGAFTSILNQILREQRGFTYGASSEFQEMKSIAPFIASSMVRSDATFESVKIFKDEMEKFRNGLSKSDLQFVKNCLLRSDALRFETNDALAGMLSTMAKYNLPADYIRQEDNIIRNLTVGDTKVIAEKYIIPDKMYYVVVGDATTQAAQLEKIGFGKPVLLKQ